MKILNNNGSIRLQFRVNGRRFTFTPIKGGRWDSQRDRQLAEMIAQTIEADIKARDFDESLDRYRRGFKQLAQKLKDTTKRLEQISDRRSEMDLKELWERYLRFKKPTVSPTTYEIDFVRRVGGAIDKLPTTNLRDAVAIRDWLLSDTTPRQARRILTQFNAAGNWGMESGLIDENPFQGMAKRINLEKGEEEINPFSLEERDQLIKLAVTVCPHFAPLIKFLFFSGCRPSEAIALKLSDIRGDKLTFKRRFVNGQLIPKLKTQRQRTIRVNDQLGDVLSEAIALLDAAQNPEPLLFPSLRGGFIDWHNFTNRAWRSLLEASEIDYRNPYQMRSTFITLALANGVSVQDVAKHCGNSPRVIWSNYAGVSRDFVMPSF